MEARSDGGRGRRRGGGEGEGEGARNSSFWKTSLPQERILFVDSPETLEFRSFLVAMEEAVIVAMDAEWKPVRKPGVLPRVSILQMSCRIGGLNSQAWSSSSSAPAPASSSSTENKDHHLPLASLNPKSGAGGGGGESLHRTESQFEQHWRASASEDHANFDDPEHAKFEDHAKFDDSEHAKFKDHANFDDSEHANFEDHVNLDDSEHAKFDDSEHAKFEDDANLENWEHAKFEDHANLDDSEHAEFEGDAKFDDPEDAKFEDHAKFDDSEHAKFDDSEHVKFEDHVKFEGLGLKKRELESRELLQMDAEFKALGLETEVLESRELEDYPESHEEEEEISEEIIEPEEFALDLDRNFPKDPENCLYQIADESVAEDSRRKEEEEEIESHLVKGEEIVFVLDLLALSASAFGLAIKAMLTSPHILKLGFAFKQDLLHLATTFPGSEAHGCFDKVEPYVDLGKLYKQIVNVGSLRSQQRGEKSSVRGTFSLAAITEVVLGMPLCKDLQCSDWEQRPLTREQIDYAAADAHCLLALFDSLLPDALHTIATADKATVQKEEIVASLHITKGIGLAEILSGNGSEESNSNIYPSMRGSATEMVKVALGCCSTSSFSRRFEAPAHQSLGLPPPPKYAKFVKKYGERLLVNVLKENANKASSSSSHQRARGYRARKAVKVKDAREVEDWDWVGPAPWDVAADGDGIPKFLCDIMVEGLARQLRCVGIDAASPSDKKNDPRQLVEQAERESRVLLTRDSKLLRRRLVPDGLAYRVKTLNKWDQLAEIIETFKIKISESDLLSRCVKCNGDFVPQPLTAKQAAAAAPWHQEIPSSVLQSCDEFWQCSACHHMYWQGSQFNRALQQFSAVCLSQDAYRS